MKKLSKGWKIFIITTVVLISSIYGYYKKMIVEKINKLLDDVYKGGEK